MLIHAHIYTHIHTYIHMHIHIATYTHITHTPTHTYTHTHKHAYTQTHTALYKCIRHTNTNTQAQVPLTVIKIYIGPTNDQSNRTYSMTFWILVNGMCVFKYEHPKLYVIHIPETHIWTGKSLNFYLCTYVHTINSYK
jgi:hypothetical protein